MIPHEHRRELRGYGTFSAWLNHVDSKSINTLDTVVEQDGKQVVRHHLLDFGSTIGSAGSTRARRTKLGCLRGGQEDAGRHAEPRALRQELADDPAVSCKIRRRLPHRQHAVGPRAVETRYANSAFRSARLDDKFWAAQRLQAFTDEMLNTLVGVGRSTIRNPRRCSKFLIERRNAILRRYLPAVNPVVDVRLSPSGS